MEEINVSCKSCVLKATMKGNIWKHEEHKHVRFIFGLNYVIAINKTRSL